MKNKIQKTLLTIFFGLVSLSFLSCNSGKLKTTELTIKKQDGKTVNVTAEIADTPVTRNYGFMNRKIIPDGTGMIFVFNTDMILSFWMKDTPHPLSIAYIDSQGRIRDIFDMTPFSLSSVDSTVSVRYALEVPKGWFDKVGVKVGDKIITNK